MVKVMFVILIITRKEDFLKPYDAKKSVWVPDGEGGFDEALIDSVEGDKVHVKVGWEPKTFKSEQVMFYISILIFPSNANLGDASEPTKNGAI